MPAGLTVIMDRPFISTSECFRAAFDGSLLAAPGLAGAIGLTDATSKAGARRRARGRRGRLLSATFLVAVVAISETATTAMPIWRAGGVPRI
jgi:hypothetical protein